MISPAEAKRAAQIAAASGTRANTALSLAGLFATVAGARLVVCVCGDTGVAHVATNYRTPSVEEVVAACAGYPTD